MEWQNERDDGTDSGTKYVIDNGLDNGIDNEINFGIDNETNIE